MLDNKNPKGFYSYGDDIDIKFLIELLLSKKILISAVIAFFTISSIIIALMLPNIYKSSATLGPSSSSESLSSQLSSFSSIASLAGVNIPSGEATKAQEGIKRIESLDFFTNHFLPFIKLEDLIAVKKWVPNNNKIVYDEDIFDEATSTWIREVKFPFQTIPTPQEAFLVYKENLDIYEDKSTSFITISIKHKSPIVARDWLQIIIENINSSMRSEDEKLAVNSIKYLNDYSKSTNIQSIKESISNLQEVQLQTLMVASSTPDYVFKMIDSPFIPELKDSPQRLIICILGLIIGTFFSILASLVSYYIEKRREEHD